MTDQFEPNEEDFSIIKSIAESDMDRPVLMLNLNRYFESVSFPDGKLYKSYMDVLSKLLESLGGKILWQMPSYGCLLYTSPSPRDLSTSRMPSSA